MAQSPEELKKLLLEVNYIIISCEGAAEREIMNLLSDNDKLIFSKEKIITITNYRKAEDIQENYLMRYYDGKVLLLRIIDSRREKFRLQKPYNERCIVIDINTVPEIEILTIISKRKFDEYNRRYKNKMKPSDYCKQILGIKDIKKRGYIKSQFINNIDILVRLLMEYERLTKRNGMLFIKDLLK